MKKLRSLLLAFLLVFALAMPSMSSNPFSPPPAFQTQTDGTIIFASIWNSSIGALYTYITTVLLPQLNTLANKGDMYVYNGSAIVAQAVGSNGQVLTANSATGSGVQWTTVAGTSPLTTKADILTVNGGGAAVRLPIGANGQTLTADSTATFGVAWENTTATFPPGMIVPFYVTYGGSIPAGWHVCDGTNGTPNLIGMYIVGGQPSGGSAAPNAAGFGATTDGTQYGITQQQFPFGFSINTSGPTNVTTVASGAVAGVATNIHFHTVGFAGNTAPATIQPAAVGITYIMKQ
jgi:hypothetical protein